MADSNLSVCTFNVWGLYVSKHRSFRIQAIADALSNSNFDVLALQELWVEKDFILLRDKLVDIYPYSHRFQAGIVGTGLAVFSKHEITKLNFFPYRLNGKPQYIFHGDWFAGKGVGHVRIRHPSSTIDFFVTHMIANYHSKQDGIDIYSVQRCMQLVDFCNFIGMSRQEDSLVIAAGDLNIEDRDPLFKEIVENGLFIDSSRFNLKSIWDDFKGINRATFNKESNSYHNSMKKEESIDHILYDTSKASCGHVSLYLTEKIDKSGVSYSDHCGVVASFSLRNREVSCEPRKSVFAEYYYDRAASHVNLLEGRQALLHMILTVSVGLSIALFVLNYSTGRNTGEKIFFLSRFVLIHFLIALAIIVLLYGNLWINFEVNQVKEVMSEWLVWQKQSI